MDPLHDAGKFSQNETLSMERLVSLQNIIIDPRHAQSARAQENHTHLKQSRPPWTDCV